MSEHDAEVAAKGPFASAAGALREVLRNRDIRRLEIAWATGTAADWAFLVVLLVVVYDAGGALAVGILTAIRTIPAIVAAPFATTLVERYEGNRVLTAINVVRGTGVLLTGLVIALDMPIEATYVLAAAVAGADSLIRPIQTALLPALARSPGELVAANVATSTGEGVGTFIGPLLAGVVVTATGSVAASIMVAAVFAGAAAAVTGVRFERKADARGGAPMGQGTRSRVVPDPRVLADYPGPALVIGDFVAQIFVRGLLLTLTVVAAIELLDMGDTGVGVLNAAIGLGGLAGAIGALGLSGGSRLTRVFAFALAGWGLPLIAIGAWPVAAVALVALFATGVSNATLDVSGFTLIQRGVRNEDRVAVFGLMETLLGIGVLAGSLVAPLLIALVGARGGLVVAGAILPILAVLTWRPIARNTRESALTEEHVALLRSNPLFAPLPLTALDHLAESLEAITFDAGETVMRKGEPGDHYLLLADGLVDVSDDGTTLRTCGRGNGVGEIALLRTIPRTATVVARTRVEGYRIDAAAFLAAVAGPQAAAAVEAVASERLEHSQAHKQAVPE